ncbi:hypothetical protein PSHT_14783 [Puccinia striiformis]|uniref:Uncharacterized protein n=1 Tax=Puccinia striiformis TaxID=27350 RepID=A0A2S4UIJ0_9BASI|nr:hypothetical protein PSHT_14783 [Puccinia striiformis]
MDWTAFQASAMQFLVMHATHLLPHMEAANLSKKINWFASITDYPKEGPNHRFLLEGSYCPQHSLLFLDEQEWVGKASPEIPTPVLYGLLAWSFKRKIATNTNHPDEPASKHHCKGVAIDLEEIEILDLAPPIQSPGTNNNPRKNKKKTFHFPMLPSRIGMERIPMEEYLNMVHIPANDVATQDLLLKWGITHWSHFWSSDKDDLLALGLLPQPASLLWEGVPRLDEYVDVMEHRFCPAFTPPPLASGSGLAHCHTAFGADKRVGAKKKYEERTNSGRAGSKYLLLRGKEVRDFNGAQVRTL